jgi:hypothetical protein
MQGGGASPAGDRAPRIIGILTRGVGWGGRWTTGLARRRCRAVRSTRWSSPMTARSVRLCPAGTGDEDNPTQAPSQPRITSRGRYSGCSRRKRGKIQRTEKSRRQACVLPVVITIGRPDSSGGDVCRCWRSATGSTAGWATTAAPTSHCPRPSSSSMRGGCRHHRWGLHAALSTLTKRRAIVRV